jgi:signal transduction histidine kinase
VHGVEVTEQVRARRRVEELAAENGRLYAEAEAALRARDQFLSIASHELRTPVTSIRGYAQMIERSRRRDDLDVERLDRAIATIRDGAERLVVLTQDLLDVSRIQGGHLALRLAPLDLRAVIADAVRARQDDLAGRHAVRTELPERDCVVVADRTRLDQVIANLLDNALKYSPAGGSVMIALQADDDGATVRVADEGIGVPTDMLERVFEPFGRAANAADSEVPGMGLGLFICRNIVALHGGRIWAQSSGPGQGTTVSFWLPRAVDDQTAN